MTSFPTSIHQFTTYHDKTDVVKAQIVNDVQNEIIALEQTLGASVGSATNTVAQQLALLTSAVVALEQALGAQGQSISTAAFVPTGTVFYTAGTTPPSGYLLCDGTTYQTSQYPQLAKVLGSTYGAGDATHFVVPDLRGRFPLGAGSGVTLGAVSAGDRHTHPTGDHALSIGEMPPHAHGVNDPGHAHGVSDPGHQHVLVLGSAHYNGSQMVSGAGTYNFLTSIGGNANVAGLLYLGDGAASDPAYANNRGAYVAASGSNIGVEPSGTGISTQNNGGGATHNHGPTQGATVGGQSNAPIMPPSTALTAIIKT